MTAAQLLSLAPMPILLVAALHDLALRRIPDWISVLTALCGLMARADSGGLLFSILSALALFAALFACWVRGWLGGGDVKLLTACSLLVPAGKVPDLLLTVAIAGGALALAYLAGRHVPFPAPSPSTGRTKPAVAARVCRAERWRIRRGGPLPYACAIAAGCAFILISR